MDQATHPSPGPSLEKMADQELARLKSARERSQEAARQLNRLPLRLNVAQVWRLLRGEPIDLNGPKGTVGSA